MRWNDRLQTCQSPLGASEVTKRTAKTAVNAGCPKYISHLPPPQLLSDVTKH